MRPRPMSPDYSGVRHEVEQQTKSPAEAAAPQPLPPPREICATSARNLTLPMDAEQYY